MKRIFFLIAILGICISCSVSQGDDYDLSDDVSVEQGAEFGTVSQELGKYCWITSWNSHWVDPNNPGSGEHVVAWFYCNDPIPTGTWQVTTDIMWNASNWLVWEGGGNTYQVFIEGWYYWPLVWFTGFTQEEAIYTVHLS